MMLYKISVTYVDLLDMRTTNILHTITIIQSRLHEALSSVRKSMHSLQLAKKYIYSHSRDG